jgi:hypothetical protein
MQCSMGQRATAPPTKLPAAAAKHVHVLTLRVSPQLAGRVKQQAEIHGVSINALVTHWVWEGLRPRETRAAGHEEAVQTRCQGSPRAVGAR